MAVSNHILPSDCLPTVGLEVNAVQHVVNQKSPDIGECLPAHGSLRTNVNVAPIAVGSAEALELQLVTDVI